MVIARNLEEEKLFKQIYEKGQRHLLRFWEQLTEEQKNILVEDLKKIDFHQLERAKKVIDEKFHLRGDFSLPEVIPVPRTDDELKREREAEKIGADFISKSRVAAFTAAGGQSSRLGLEIPKGCYPVTPVKHKSLFQVFAEKILYMQEKYGANIPWVIMVSETNDLQTREFFQEHDFFGLDKNCIRFIRQDMFPAVDENGKILLAEKHRIYKSPTGHGGALSTLWDSKTCEWLKEKGIEGIFYFQVDNVLVKVLDPVFIGYHVSHGCKMSSKCVKKKNPDEKMGVFALWNGITRVVEYTETSVLEVPEKGLKASQFNMGNIAIHMLNLNFVEELNRGGLKLPWHRAHKKIPYIDEHGNRVIPQKPNGYKFETFIFDALVRAGNSIVMEIKREEEFSPLKNSEGEDSPQTILRDQLYFFARWFEKAGIKIPFNNDGIPVHRLEVSPLFASLEEDFINKINKKLEIKGDTYID